MNKFWGYNRNLDEHYLNFLSSVGEKIFLSVIMFIFGIAFSGYNHLFITSFPAVLFIVIIGISIVDINNASLWKIEPGILQSVNIMEIASKYGKFNRDVFCRGINLPCKTIKVFSDQGLVASEFFPIPTSDKGDTGIFPNIHKETITDIFSAVFNFLITTGILKYRFVIST
jgi:hypothetical protein